MKSYKHFPVVGDSSEILSTATHRCRFHSLPMAMNPAVCAERKRKKPNPMLATEFDAFWQCQLCPGPVPKDQPFTREKPIRLVTVTEKTCRRCHKTKPASEFYPTNKSSNGLMSYCKVCCRAAANKTKAAHRDKSRA